MYGGVNKLRGWLNLRYFGSITCNPIIYIMKNIRHIVLVIVVFLAGADFAFAQKLPGLDPSPADIAYLRENGRRSTAVAKVIYGRPQKKGRTMLGGTEAFGKVWRLGANETTEIKLFRDVTFGDKVVKAGTYSLYAIPNAAEWTIIFNSKLDTWGAYEYEESKDVVRFNVSVGKADAEVEALAISFDDPAGTGKATMYIGWETTLVKIPVKF